MKCKRGSRKKSKTRCFDKDDNVVVKRTGKCPPRSRKISKTRCFDKDDIEIYRTRAIHRLPSDALNRIHAFNMSTETTSDLTPNRFANASRLNLQNPSFVSNMVRNLILDNYHREPVPPLLSPAEFKEKLKRIYRKNKVRPIPLTPEEERELNRLEDELNENLNVYTMTEADLDELDDFEHD
jgi:hypothetical protein